MPLYEFHCKQCGNRFERIMQYSDVQPTVCEKCGGEVEQLISAPSVQFKGSGFYQTDYKVGKPGSKLPGSKPVTAGTSSESGGGSSDSKSDSQSSGSSSGESSKPSSSESSSSSSGESKPSTKSDA